MTFFVEIFTCVFGFCLVKSNFGKTGQKTFSRTIRHLSGLKITESFGFGQSVKTKFKESYEFSHEQFDWKTLRNSRLIASSISFILNYLFDPKMLVLTKGQLGIFSHC